MTVLRLFWVYFAEQDHDDGSCYYNDTYNVMIYGGYKNYLGHSKIVPSPDNNNGIRLQNCAI